MQKNYEITFNKHQEQCIETPAQMLTQDKEQKGVNTQNDEEQVTLINEAMSNYGNQGNRL